MEHDILEMWHQWHQCQHHMMLMALSMAPLHSSCPDNWNEMWLDFLFMSCHWYQCQSNACTCQKLICASNATYKPHVLISSCAHITELYHCICLIWTQCYQTMWPGTLIYSHLTLHACGPEHMPPTSQIWMHYVSAAHFLYQFSISFLGNLHVS